MRPVSVIIPAWNLWDMTLACLHSLAQCSTPGSIEVIVVDNGSTDATASALQDVGTTLFGHYFQAIRLPENLGFAKGCNVGAAAATGDLLFFLNNDTLVTPQWLPPLCAALESSPALGMAGPLLLYPDTNEVQHCGVTAAPTRYVEHLYERFPAAHPLAHKRRLLQAITGAALLIPAQLFAQCGRFHEGYQNGCEDIDLCCAVRQKGKHLTTVPQSVVYHRVSQTPGRADHNDTNFDLLQSRWPAGLVPDMHRMALEDGFVPTLTPTLHLCLELPPEKTLALKKAFSEHFDAERCQARLLAEPLWREGYTLLADHLEKTRQWDAACAVYTRLTHFFPLARHFARLAKLAARAGRRDLMLYASAKTQQYTPSPAGTAQKAAHVRSLQRAYAPLQDEGLQTLFRHWLATYAPSASPIPPIPPAPPVPNVPPVPANAT